METTRKQVMTIYNRYIVYSYDNFSNDNKDMENKKQPNIFVIDDFCCETVKRKIKEIN